MELRTCTSCNTIFPETTEFFYQQRNKKKDRIFFRSICKTCFNQKKRERKYSEKVLALKEQLKEELAKEAAEKENLCKDCGKIAAHNGENGLCTECANAARRHNEEIEKTYKEFEAQKAEELKEENEWLKEVESKMFYCRFCEQEKPFHAMKQSKKRKKVESRCKACYNEKHKEYDQNYKANIFVKTLEKRRERTNAEQ